VRTSARRVDGGFVVTGQKVWTSWALRARFGLATVRTDAGAAKHAGITTLVIDMRDPRVDVRPLRQITGAQDFNEVFLNDVFVPDSDVIGAVNDGWRVARATLANERVSLGGRRSLGTAPEAVASFDPDRDEVAGGVARVARFLSTGRAIDLLELRRVERAVAGDDFGAEGAVGKIARAAHLLEGAALAGELAGDELAFLDGRGAAAAHAALGAQALSIGGGTVEVARNVIGERILGLPRDPLLR
jgi:alkylation response protein AidB-like acyl-CoA dehydrogenase